MINDRLRELRVRLDQIERIALVIPTKYWPDAFEAVLQGCEIMVGIAEREPDQDFSTKDPSKLPGPQRSRPSLWSDADGIEPAGPSRTCAPHRQASSGLACVARERHHRTALCGAELGPRVHELAPLLERLSEANQKISTLTAGMKGKQIKAPAIQSQIDAILKESTAPGRILVRIAA